MSTSDILSQDEIDALLGGVEEGDVETETAPAVAAEEVPAYDFTSQDRIVRGRMPTLDMVNERFARRFRASLYEMLRNSPDLACAGVRTLKYGEYVNSLFMPTSMNLIRMHPLRGTALLTFDPEFVFTVVDNFFGGVGRFRNKIEGRDFTTTETRVIKRLIEHAFVDLREAWAPVLPCEFELQGSEVNPHFANIVAPSEVVVVSTFTIELEGGGGELHVAQPYQMIEPIRALLDSTVKTEHDERDERWRSSLREELEGAEVELSSTLARATLSLRELLACSDGSVVPIEMPETVVVCAEDVPVLRGRYGVSDGQLAVRVEEMIKHTRQDLVACPSEVRDE